MPSSSGYAAADKYSRPWATDKMLRMLRMTFLFGALCVWRYRDDDRAKQAFVLSFTIEVIHFLVKFVLHRRQWANYVPIRPFLYV